MNAIESNSLTFSSTGLAKAGERSSPKIFNSASQRSPALTQQKLENAPVLWQTVTTYQRRNCKFYRYRAGIGHKITHDRHIPGGNIQNPIAQARAIAIQYAICHGRSPDQILQLIKKWTAGNSKKNPAQKAGLLSD